VFTNPRPSRRRLSDFYAADDYECHEPDCSAAAHAKWAFVFDRITRAFPESAPTAILDYGAGSGGLLLHAQRNGWTATGFEPAPRGLRECRAAGLNVTDCLSELPDRAFGVITLHHVLEHLPDSRETLTTLRRLLAPEGRLYVEVPNRNSLRAGLAAPTLTRRFSVDERYRAYPIHLAYYTAQTLCQLLECCGWDVRATHTSGLGIDNFILRAPAPVKAPQPSNTAAAAPVARPMLSTTQRLKRAGRDAFFSAGLGENLGVVATCR
jgi:SAM-dependent methyltransferase